MTNDEQWLCNEKYGGIPSPEFEADRLRLAAGEPLAYLIGHIPFLGTTIHLDSHPLIPRPETEYWVEQVIIAIRSKQTSIDESDTNKPSIRMEGSGARISQTNAVLRVLDLCAGSGAIGVAVANAVPEAHVTFAEIDPAHLPTIAKNLDVNGIDCTRYQIFQSDLFANVSGTFDFILSNPPYIDSALDRTETSVTAHEPHKALYGGTDGMELIACIIANTPAYLTKEGQLWLEHEPEQVNRIQELAHEHGFAAVTHTDQYKLERYTTLTFMGGNPR